MAKHNWISVSDGAGEHVFWIDARGRLTSRERAGDTMACLTPIRTARGLNGETLTYYRCFHGDYVRHVELWNPEQIRRFGASNWWEVCNPMEAQS